LKKLMPVVLWLAAVAPMAQAQCVMCFRTAAAQNKARAQVLNSGILVLGVPPFLILAGFVALAVKRSKTYREE
jgi:hypothetical protein